MPETRGKALALGTFDGVHLAHRTLVRQAARAGGPCGASAVTFDRLPGSLLGTNGKTRQIVSLEDKVALLKMAGADDVEVLRFDEGLCHMEAEDFFERLIVRRFQPSSLTVGHDYRFGRHGKGDVDLLERLCSLHGIALTVIDEIDKNGIRISSTEIRRRIAAGEPKAAAEMLGRWHFIKVRREGALLLPVGGIELPPADMRFYTKVFSHMPVIEGPFEGFDACFAISYDGTSPEVRLCATGTEGPDRGSYVLFGPRA
ncbi:MAG TPA: FAD synthetase family protein [Bacillota bacterium]|nr:FAD synthetase family protein [Bacillota bacterium]HOA15555.1 FAD synthetase family protein [Bacillota bacterium]